MTCSGRPGRADAAIKELAHESDPLRIVRVAIAGAYVDRLGRCAEGLHRFVTGRHQQARDHVAAARNVGLDALSPRLRMLLQAAAALAADDDRHPGFHEALAVEGAERWPFDLARIQLYYGERLRRGKTPARAPLPGTCGGDLPAARRRPWADRASQELRACGSPMRTACGPEAAVLTPQQREIALPAAAGLSNKQIGKKLFLSPRTVSTHLYQLFPKLGVTSRTALRDALDTCAGTEARLAENCVTLRKRLYRPKF